MNYLTDTQIRVDEETKRLIDNFRELRKWSVKQAIKHIVRTHPAIKRLQTNDDKEV